MGRDRFPENTQNLRLRFGAGDEVDRIGDIFLRLLNRIGDRLHNGDAECHALLQTGTPVSVRA